MNEAALDILKKHVEISLSQSTFSTAIVGSKNLLWEGQSDKRPRAE